MTAYVLLKWLHLTSAAVLLGTGAGIAFFTWMGYVRCRRTRDLAGLREILEITVIADWVFTTTAIVVQFGSGIALMAMLGVPWFTTWSAMVIALFLLAGACWVPVVIIQYRLRDIARAASSWGDLGEEFARQFRLWFALGMPAFAAVIALYGLMLIKPGFGAAL